MSTPHLITQGKRNRERIYEYILAEMQAKGGVPPTIRQIMDEIGYHTTSVVSYQLDRLEEEGRIARTEDLRRLITIPGATWTPPTL